MPLLEWTDVASQLKSVTLPEGGKLYRYENRFQDRFGDEEVAAALAHVPGAYLNLTVIDEVVTLTNAVETNMATPIPAGAVIASVQANLDTAVAGDASGDDLLAKVGIGATADPDLYGKTSGLTKNLKIDTIPDWAVLAAETTLAVCAVKTAGAASTEKFVAGGLVRVRVAYFALTSLADEA